MGLEGKKGGSYFLLRFTTATAANDANATTKIAIASVDISGVVGVGLPLPDVFGLDELELVRLKTG